MCVGIARIGGAYQAFWAVHNRTTDAFRDRAALWPIVHFDHTSARFDGVDVTYERAGAPVEVVSRHGKYPIWTRKTPVHVTGTIDGIDIDSHGSAGVQFQDVEQRPWNRQHHGAADFA